MAHKTNRLLASLSDDAHQTLKPHLVEILLKQHEVIFDVREAIPKVHFPIDAVISLVVPLATGEIVETAMVGRDGVIGACAALNGKVSSNRGVAGAVALAGSADLYGSNELPLTHRCPLLPFCGRLLTQSGHRISLK